MYLKQSTAADVILGNPLKDAEKILTRIEE
jgi:hypothetical protein